MAKTIIVTPAVPGNQPSGHYATTELLKGVDGWVNLVSYSQADGELQRDSDNNNEPVLALNTVRVQLALDHADAWINGKIRRYATAGGFSVPVRPVFTEFALLQQAAAYVATAWLYNARAGRDMAVDATGQYDPSQNKANLWMSWADKLVKHFIEAATNALPPGTFQSVPLEHETDRTGFGIYPFGGRYDSYGF